MLPRFAQPPEMGWAYAGLDVCIACHAISPCSQPSTLQALLDMLAGFAMVASGTDAGGGSRQYVRPVLTEVGWGVCSAAGDQARFGQLLRSVARFSQSACCLIPTHRRGPSRLWRRGIRCWSAWTPPLSSPTTPTWRCPPPSTSSLVGLRASGQGTGGGSAVDPRSKAALHCHDLYMR